jgi:hypothetical protein
MHRIRPCKSAAWKGPWQFVPSAWWQRFRFELILLVVAIVGAALLFAPVDWNGWIRNGTQLLPDLRQLMVWATPTRLASIAGGVALLLLVLWRVRHHLQQDPVLASHHCPRCGHDSVTRIHRRTGDRWLGLVVNLPLYRYRCGNPACSWQGLLLSRSRSGPISEFFNPSPRRRRSRR